MIRNYYTDSYKSGIAVTPSDTLLLDGRTKSTTPQGAWKEYNIYIGNSPSALPVTTTGDNSIVSNSTNVGLASPNATGESWYESNRWYVACSWCFNSISY